MNKTMFETVYELHTTSGKLNAMLEAFGYALAKREGYKHHEGLDAIHWYLIERYHWTPAVVKSLSFEDLHFLMREVSADWTLPKELRSVGVSPAKKSSRSKSFVRT